MLPDISFHFHFMKKELFYMAIICLKKICRNQMPRQVGWPSTLLKLPEGFYAPEQDAILSAGKLWVIRFSEAIICTIILRSGVKQWMSVVSDLHECNISFIRNFSLDLWSAPLLFSGLGACLFVFFTYCFVCPIIKNIINSAGRPETT